MISLPCRRMRRPALVADWRCRPEARRDDQGRFHGAACRQRPHNARRNHQRSEISRAPTAVKSAVAELELLVSAARTVLDDVGQGPEPIS